MSLLAIEQMELRMGTQIFTAHQRDAAAFLESKGRRFLYEYGYENCEAQAQALGWQRPNGLACGKPVGRIKRIAVNLMHSWES